MQPYCPILPLVGQVAAVAINAALGYIIFYVLKLIIRVVRPD